MPGRSPALYGHAMVRLRSPQAADTWPGAAQDAGDREAQEGVRCTPLHERRKDAGA